MGRCSDERDRRAGLTPCDLQIIASCLPAEAVALFGSRVRGESTETSDIAILVVGALGAVQTQAAFVALARCHGWHPYVPINSLTVSRGEIEHMLRDGSIF
jgi:hypothetical protein